ncbi:hypothetical protein B0H10DRAFT_1998114 [Mycena sp. CBHHK59/15]|nr:hypothetical protein B0H10DRAFT_1998114 [Mycena sp. CBHHK59/15]
MLKIRPPARATRPAPTPCPPVHATSRTSSRRLRLRRPCHQRMHPPPPPRMSSASDDEEGGRVAARAPLPDGDARGPRKGWQACSRRGLLNVAESVPARPPCSPQRPVTIRCAGHLTLLTRTCSYLAHLARRACVHLPDRVHCAHRARVLRAGRWAWARVRARARRGLQNGRACPCVPEEDSHRGRDPPARRRPTSRLLRGAGRRSPELECGKENAHGTGKAGELLSLRAQAARRYAAWCEEEVPPAAYKMRHATSTTCTSDDEGLYAHRPKRWARGTNGARGIPLRRIVQACPGLPPAGRRRVLACTPALVHLHFSTEMPILIIAATPRPRASNIRARTTPDARVQRQRRAFHAPPLDATPGITGATTRPSSSLRRTQTPSRRHRELRHAARASGVRVT